MRALVTGATGFVGAYLTERLVCEGADVTILRRPESDVWRLSAILPQVSQIVGDLRNLEPIETEIADFAPEVVFHLAWYGVGNSHRRAEAQVDHNLFSTLALVRLARKVGCGCWIGLGSQAEYGPQNQVLQETAPTHPSSLYGATKLAACVLSEQLCAGSEMRFAWLRLFSSYGPKDNPDWMIPYLTRKLLCGEKPALTSAEQQWDYLYVGDAAEAIFRVAQCPEARGVFNLGSGQAHTLRYVIESIRDLIDPALPLGFGEVPYRPDQVMHLQANITKLESVTGWKPRTPLDQGLSKTVRWIQANERIV